MAPIFDLGTTHFKISQDGPDCFTWPLGQAQGVINSLVEHLRAGGLPNVNHFTVIPFQLATETFLDRSGRENICNGYIGAGENRNSSHTFR